MSVTTSESENESKPDSAEQKSITSESGSSQTESSADDAQADFDAESLEISFGLPPGSLKDVKDADSAFEAVRTMTDKILTAGVGFAPPADEKPAEKKAAPKADEKPGSGGNAEIDALRAELAEVKGIVAQQTAQAQRQESADVERRVRSKIDSWASPKYGVTGTRNWRQTRAVQEFVDVLLPNMVAGRRAAGLAVSTKDVEAYMEQLRVFDDDTYKPTKKAADKQTLGTPGATKGAAEQKVAPGNIHQALMKNPH